MGIIILQKKLRPLPIQTVNLDERGRPSNTVEIGCQTPTLFAPFKRTSGPLPSVLDEFPFGGVRGRHGKRHLFFGDKLAAAQHQKQIKTAKRQLRINKENPHE